jgi:hypothetical protein
MGAAPVALNPSRNRHMLPVPLRDSAQRFEQAEIPIAKP